MEVIDTILEVLVVVLIMGLIGCIGGVIWCTYMLYRNDKVFSFRRELVDKLPLKQYKTIPCYQAMLYSWKPLKPEYWLSTGTLEELERKQEPSPKS